MYDVALTYGPTRRAAWRGRSRRFAIGTAVVLALASAGATIANAGDDQPWEPGRIEGRVDQIEYTRWNQGRAHGEIEAMLATAETEVEEAAIRRLDERIQTMLEETISELCAGLDAERAATAGC